jgi:hypothetical protein
MAVACCEMIAVPAGPERADGLAALVPGTAWQRLSCADGSKGLRLYDWALIETAAPGHWLLARRSLHPGEKGGLERHRRRGPHLVPPHWPGAARGCGPGPGQAGRWC